MCLICATACAFKQDTVLPSMFKASDAVQKTLVNFAKVNKVTPQDVVLPGDCFFVCCERNKNCSPTFASTIDIELPADCTFLEDHCIDSGETSFQDGVDSGKTSVSHCFDSSETSIQDGFDSGKTSTSETHFTDANKDTRGLKTAGDETCDNSLDDDSSDVFDETRDKLSDDNSLDVFDDNDEFATLVNDLKLKFDKVIDDEDEAKIVHQKDSGKRRRMAQHKNGSKNRKKRKTTPKPKKQCSTDGIDGCLCVHGHCTLIPPSLGKSQAHVIADQELSKEKGPQHCAVPPAISTAADMDLFDKQKKNENAMQFCH